MSGRGGDFLDRVAMQMLNQRVVEEANMFSIAAGVGSGDQAAEACQDVPQSGDVLGLAQQVAGRGRHT